jgi:hypothetical protein
VKKNKKKQQATATSPPTNQTKAQNPKVFCIVLIFTTTTFLLVFTISHFTNTISHFTNSLRYESWLLHTHVGKPWSASATSPAVIIFKKIKKEKII